MSRMKNVREDETLERDKFKSADYADFRRFNMGKVFLV
jgi:hypothetical protein